MIPSHRLYKLLFILLSSIVSISLAQNSPGALTESIYSASIFSSQKPCAQGCFMNPNFGCSRDLLGIALGCKAAGVCGAQTWPATNDCFCRTDLQPAASSYLSSCISAACTVGDNAIDVSSAASIYGSYCGGYAKAVSTPIATGQAGGAVKSATPANTATSPGSTQTSDSNSQNNQNNNSIQGGNQNVNVNIGKSSAAHTQDISKIIVGVTISVVICILGAGAFWWFRRRKSLEKAKKMHDTNELQSVPRRDVTLRKEFRSELDADVAKENNPVQIGLKPAVLYGAAEMHAGSRPLAHELS